MIDPEMFPKEYAAIESLKLRSQRFERDRDKKRAAKQAMIEKCRRKLDEQSGK